MRLVGIGIAVYYAAGVTFSAVAAHRVARRRVLRVRGRGARAVAVARARARPPLARARRLRRLRRGGVAHDGAPARGGACRARRGACASTRARSRGACDGAARRRSPATSCRSGLMGFPGVGWLFAGFPLTASILLLVGPALTWAVIPVAFSPYGQGPLRDVGWKVELVWLPAMALLSSALLYRAHARRRARLDGQPPRAARRRRAAATATRVSARARRRWRCCSWRSRSCPRSPGVGGSTVRYSYEPRLTPEVTGQFVSTKRGPVKLFAWQRPAGHVRRRTRFGSMRGTLRALLVRAAALDCGQGLPAVRPRPGRLGPARRPSRASPRELVLAPGGRCGRGATPSSPPTRGCSGDATSPTCASCRPSARRRRSAPGRTRRPRGARRAAAALRGAARARLRARCSSARCYAAARARRCSGPSASSSSRVAAALRGARAADRLEPGALPHLLPRGRRPDRRLPRRRLGLAAAAEPRRATGSPAGSRSRRPRRWRPWRSPASTPRTLASTAHGRPPANSRARRTRVPVGGRRSTRSAACS